MGNLHGQNYFPQDSELCPLPSVVSLDYVASSGSYPYDFVVTWESPDTNMTGLKGFIVAYHRLDRNDQARSIFSISVLPTMSCFFFTPP